MQVRGIMPTPKEKNMQEQLKKILSLVDVNQDAGIGGIGGIGASAASAASADFRKLTSSEIPPKDSENFWMFQGESCRGFQCQGPC